MQIGKVRLGGNLLLAPMAEVTNLAYRVVCRRRGASFAFTEMINSEAILHDNAKSHHMALSCPDEGIFGVQIFGRSPVSMAKAACLIENETSPSIIDINAGCPSPRIRKTGAGSMLMENPDVLENIIQCVVESVTVPVTVKIRVFRDVSQTVELASRLENAGVSAITVHGRTAMQQYSGVADHLYARRIKEKLSIPVIANGDIRHGAFAAQILEYTGCDGLMIGRAAMGDPDIFSRIAAFLESGIKFPPADCDQRKSSLEEYLKLLEAYGLDKKVNLAAHSAWFTRGLAGSRSFRKSIQNVKSSEGIISRMEMLCREA
ncbi:tRNA dihydrouridine synthase DusB [Methanohalophilus profundi]|uniref:tRNA dihydrouridine synthase DusB n=1 Tax=Methanohalophilus profundi TaxID=2138083 RepID=UPI00101C1070|nr:tRNA dihydrouridine synthase DusB [Methanohalophilus profundi]